MGSSAWFRVAFLVLFVISVQTAAKPQHLFFPEREKLFGLSDSSAQNVLPQSSFLEAVPPRPVQEPFKESVSIQSQLTQVPWKEFVRKYPQMPVEPTHPSGPIVPEVPVPADSVAVRCSEANIEVEVHQDFFGTGQLIKPAEIRLGDCFMTGDDLSARVLIFNVELHQCGSSLQMTEDELVYTFTLVYTPQAIGGTPILRTNRATVDIQCRYARQQNVSSESVSPTWIPFSASEVAEDVLVFYLRLMTADWKSEQATNAYYLGDLLHIEASVSQYKHVPLRVFVQSCWATAVADVNTSPRYSFIENNGCFIDAKLTGSRSRFLPRAQDNKLQFELEAFRFAQGDHNEIYITCQLVANTASTVSSNKACSFSGDGWTCSDGTHEMCACCDTTCGSEGPTDAGQWQTKAFLGPIKVDE